MILAQVALSQQGEAISAVILRSSLEIGALNGLADASGGTFAWNCALSP